MDRRSKTLEKKKKHKYHESGHKSGMCETLFQYKRSYHVKGNLYDVFPTFFCERKVSVSNPKNHAKIIA